MYAILFYVVGQCSFVFASHDKNVSDRRPISSYSLQYGTLVLITYLHTYRHTYLPKYKCTYVHTYVNIILYLQKKQRYRYSRTYMVAFSQNYQYRTVRYRYRTGILSKSPLFFLSGKQTNGA